MQYVVQETATNVFAEVAYGASIEVGDVVHAWQITELWPAAELEAIGVFHVAPAPAPHPSATVKGYRFERVEGVVVQLLDIELPPGNTLDMIATARQIRLAMNELGLRDGVEAWVALQPRDVRDSWEYTTEFRINHPFIQAAKVGMNQSDEALFGLFSLAQTYT
jgi:molybdopterin-binding protein